MSCARVFHQKACMAIYELDGRSPQVPTDGHYFIADSAEVIGNVGLAAHNSLWFGSVALRDTVPIGHVRLAANTSIRSGSVLRGDNELLDIGEKSHVQDNCTFHTDPGFPM